MWQAESVPVDPNAIATWANAVTVGRILVSPLMFVVIPDYPGGSWVAFALWFVLCSSDGIDGYLARRHGATRSGAFLDPLADKVLVLGAMFTLVSRDVYWVVPVLIIPLTADDGTWLWLWLLWIAVFLTTTSGLQYMWRAQRLKRAALNPAG